MSEVPPLLLTYEGEGSFSPPSPHWARLADKHYVIGERYPLVQHQERTHNTHAHFFATVADAWQNLPDDLAERFPTSEHLRKYCLIKGGFCDTHTLVCSSKSEAVRIASFMRPIDQFAVITVKDQTVTRYTAQSQSMRAMDKQRFQASKDAVLDILAKMLEVTKPALEANKGNYILDSHI